jgi:tetratricopeptide (TPR) repeat protein
VNRKQRRAEYKQKPSMPSLSVDALEARFGEALSNLQTGRLNQAERILQTVPSSSHRYADSLHVLGLIQGQTGRAAMALDSIAKAIKLRSTDATYYYNHGLIALNLEKFLVAEEDFRNALQLNPQFAEATHSLASTLHKQQRQREAVPLLMELTEKRPKYAQAHSLLGTIYVDLGEADLALVSLNTAQLLNSDNAQIYFNLGVNFSRLDRPDQAIEAYQNALRIDPTHTDALLNIGVMYKLRGEFESAKAAYNSILNINPLHYVALSNIGAVAMEEGQLGDASEAFERALALNADFSVAHNNLATVRQRQMRLDEAIQGFRRSIALSSNSLEVHHNLALALLTHGELRSAWPEYESRWGSQLEPNAAIEALAPRWRGEAAEGKILLVYAEQGLGDSIQFVRYVGLAAELGLRVLLRVQAPLVGLMRTMAGNYQVASDDGPLPSFDYQIPMLSLPLVFDTSLDTIPSQVPYLHADPAKVAQWRARLAPSFAAKRRVGLVWAGSAELNSDRRRSIDAALLKPILSMKNLAFVSLQKPNAPAWTHPQMIDLMDDVHDFADTAAIIENLDLVVSVDTSVAHLAGALGKKIWLLNRFDTDWRWFAERVDSPWYPTMQIFRQKRAGDWHDPIGAVASALAQL